MPNRPKEQDERYKFDIEAFSRSVTETHVYGTSLCLQISRIKIHTPVTYEVIEILEKAHLVNPQIVHKFHDSFVIRGYCQGTIEATEMHTVVMKDKKGNWIRGTRADEPYHAYKVYRSLINDPISKNAL